jgi:endonuclease YncB( thermonuclease family)
MNWIVPATVVRVMDGDTILCLLDLGWRVKLDGIVRIDGISADELETLSGMAALKYAQVLLTPGDLVTVVSKKILGEREKYGRCLADLGYGFPRVSFAEAMLKAGHAKPWDGLGEPP